MVTPVETAKRAGTRKGVPAKLDDMIESEQAEVKQAVEQTKQASASIDLNRLANTVDGYEPKPNYIVKSALGMELIWCPPGSFIMGLFRNDEAHPVILTKGFYLGKYEVTQEQYQKVIGTNPSNFKGDKLPVDKVSWYKAVEFCEALNEKERIPSGWKFALPTEAQWEYACRAGTTTAYSFGDKITSDDANYNWDGDWDTGADFKQTRDVGSYSANPWGFFDMHGNVREWTADWYGTYPSNLVIDPRGPTEGSHHFPRGGSWRHIGMHLRSASPGRRNPGVYPYEVGFRVALKQVD